MSAAFAVWRLPNASATSSRNADTSSWLTPCRSRVVNLCVRMSSGVIDELLAYWPLVRDVPSSQSTAAEPSPASVLDGSLRAASRGAGPRLIDGAALVGDVAPVGDIALGGDVALVG